MVYRYFKHLVTTVSRIHLGILAGLYILAYLAIESLVQNYIQLYIFTVFLALSGVYFSWFRGGKGTMIYVAFLNLFIVFVFSRLLWTHHVIGLGVFKSKSFIIMYTLSVLFFFLVAWRKSPADARQEEQAALIEDEKRHRQNLEFMVASKKLKEDLLAQANLVKDELQLLEGTWKSSIHDIKNDLTVTEEQLLYSQIVIPFRNNILRHLKDLEFKLTFDTLTIPLSDLTAFLTEKLDALIPISDAGARKGPAMKIDDTGWRKSDRRVHLDKNKLWDMVHNITMNSRAAIDLKKIDRLTARDLPPFEPEIRISMTVQDTAAHIVITDNGGGIRHEPAEKLFRQPVSSVKRRKRKHGQGTLFVKFFAERMDIGVRARNIRTGEDHGLEVTLCIPLVS